MATMPNEKSSRCTSVPGSRLTAATEVFERRRGLAKLVEHERAATVLSAAEGCEMQQEPEFEARMG
jgi:hypothetical protein